MHGQQDIKTAGRCGNGNEHSVSINAGNFTKYGGSTGFKIRNLLHGFSLVGLLVVWLVGWLVS